MNRISRWSRTVGGARQQMGVSMVEILVALALSLVLTLGVTQIYLGSKQSYRLQEAQSRLQENGRYAMETLVHDLRLIGYRGCSLMAGAPIVISLAPPLSDSTANPLGSPVTGYEGSNKAWLPNTSGVPGWPGVPEAGVENTDVINLQFAQPCGGRLQARVGGGTGSIVNIAPANTCSVTPSVCAKGDCASGDVLILADCGHVELFRVDSAIPEKTPTQLTFTTATNRLGWLTYTHDLDAEVMLYKSHIYFIRSFNGEPTLYRQDNSSGSGAQPLVEGVEDLQILYGVDLDADGSPNQYLDASQVNDWTRIVAVHVDLLLRSPGDEGRFLSSVTTNPCNGANLDAAQQSEGRLRKCFSSTIGLRNMRVLN